MSDDPILTKLDELIAVSRAAAIPFEHRWLDAAAVAAMLGVSVGHFRDRIAPKPGFPEPARYTGGAARWKASEVDAWAARQITRAA